VSTSDKPAGGRFVGTRAEGVALVLFTACCWGLTWPQNKFLLTQLPPFTMRTIAGVLAAVFGFAMAFARREKLTPPADQRGKLFLFAMLNFGLFVVLTTEALVWLKASEAVVITYTLPIWASVMAWPMLGERPNGRKLLAILLGLAGVALMVDIGSAEARWEKLPGAAFGFTAAWMFGLGTVVAKKHPLRMPPSASVAWQCALGCIPVILLAVFEHPNWSRVTPLGWAALAYIATIPMTVAYLAWFRALKLVAASTAATTVLVSPMMGVLGSAMLLGETLGPRQWVALALTLTGVALAARG
jgi:drug/metabolite transporter (DMT)-like permease